MLLFVLLLLLSVGCESGSLSCASSKTLSVTIHAEAAFMGIQSAVGKEVIFDFTKNGGDRFTFTKTVGEEYRCSATVGYNLHKGERVEVKASVQGNTASISGGTAQRTLTYEEASTWVSEESYDNTVDWYPVLTPTFE
jgi:hypothetical protein